MQIDKDTIVNFLKKRGEDDKAAKADAELPGKVDTDKDRGLLSRFGVDVQDLLDRLPGGIADKLPDGISKKLDDIL